MEDIGVVELRRSILPHSRRKFGETGHYYRFLEGMDRNGPVQDSYTHQYIFEGSIFRLVRDGLRDGPS